MRILIASAALLMAVHSAYCEPSDDFFTLERSVETALSKNENISIAKTKIDSARSKLAQSKAGFLPMLSADLYGGHAVREDRQIIASGVTASQPVYTGGELTAKLRKAEIDLDLAEINLDKSIDELVLEVKKAYYGVLSSREYKKLAEESVERLRLHLYAVRQLYEKEMAAKVEVLKTEYSLLQAEQNLVEAKNDLKQSKEAFNSLVGRPLDAKVEVQDMPEYMPVAISLGEFYRLAYKNIVELREADKLSINDKIDVKIAASKKYPHVSFDTSYAWQKDDYIDRNDLIVGASVKMDIWDWGAADQEIKQAKLIEQENAYKLALLKKEIDLDLRDAYYQMLTVESSIKLAKKSIESAEECFKKESIRFKNNLSTNKDVLDAHVALSKAKAYYNNVMNRFSMGRASLSRFAGKRYIEEVERPLLRDITDDEFLDLVSRKAFYYFLDNQNEKSGLFEDTVNGDASIAVTGFGLSALCIGAERGWAEKKDAGERALRCIRTLLNANTGEGAPAAEGKYGYFYHFLDIETGARSGNAELSTVDTALLICGALTAGEYFGGEVKKAADELYARVEWEKLYDAEKDLFYMGWKPDSGFLSYYWDYYTDEVMLISLLASGSPSHPVTPKSFYAWKREKGGYKDGPPFIYSWRGALFTYQYAHAWFDFRDKVDETGTDWWQNSVDATMAGVNFCADNSSKFKGFGADSWGITSYDTPSGYTMSQGFPPCGTGSADHDGTVSPSGPAGSIAFAPPESISAMKNFYGSYQRLWGPYGFKSSFNLDKDWFSQEYYGLESGITLLMIENYRSGLIWKHFMQSSGAQEALKRTGFTQKPKEER